MDFNIYMYHRERTYHPTAVYYSCTAMLRLLLVLLGVGLSQGCTFRKAPALAKSLGRLAEAHLPGNGPAFTTLGGLETMRALEDGGAVSLVLFSVASNAQLPAAAAHVYEVAMFGTARAAGAAASAAGVLHMDLGVYAAAEQLEVDTAKTALRRQLTDAVARCPLRTLVVISGAHLLRGDAVQLLDAFMGVLDGRRGTLTGADPGTLTFLFLMPTLALGEGADGMAPHDWKERLERAWAFEGPEFTAGALVGRLSAAVSLRTAKPVNLESTLAGLSTEARLDADRIASSGYAGWMGGALLVAFLFSSRGGGAQAKAAPRKTASPAKKTNAAQPTAPDAEPRRTARPRKAVATG